MNRFMGHIASCTLIAGAAIAASAHAQIKPVATYCDGKVQLTQFAHSIETHENKVKVTYSVWVKNTTNTPIGVGVIFQPRVQAGMKDITSGSKSVPALKSSLIRFGEWNGDKHPSGKYALDDHTLSLNTSLACVK